MSAAGASRAKATSGKPPRGTAPDPRPGRVRWGIAVAAAGAVAVLFAIYTGNHHSTTASPGGNPAGRFEVGAPAPGAAAPEIQLPSTSGGTFDLAAQRGKTVLLYFQEGLTCEPCWTQIRDIEKDQTAITALGVDQLVSITTDPLKLLRQKVTDEGLRTAVLSDSTLAVSKAYHANSYGMMGQSRDGHSFVLVGPDGRIRWRADYGGAPNYTMYVSVNQLAADIKAGLAANP
jgi:peroxiredoxin